MIETLYCLVRQGFTPDLPDEPGVYKCTCHETDFEPYTVEVVLIDGELHVNDPECGTNPISQYDLTYLLWKKD